MPQKNMNRSQLDSMVLRYAGFAMLFMGTAYALYRVRGAMPVFIIGGIIAYALEPVLQRLERRGYSRSGAVGFVFLIYFLLFLIMIALLVAAMQQATSLPTQVTAWLPKIGDWITHQEAHINSLKLPPTLKKGITDGIAHVQASVTTGAPNYVESLAQWALGSVGTILILVVLLPIVTLWFMMEAEPIRARILMLIPPMYRRDFTEIAASINELLGRYVRGQLIVCSTYGVLCTIAFEILGRVYGMNYPLVLGVMAAVIYIIPYVGMAVIGLSVGLTAYFTSHSPVPCTVTALVCCLVFNLTVDYGISPRVLGKGVGLHPLMVIFALLCGAQIGGPLGMIFAVPFFASLRVIAIYLFPQLTAPIPHETLREAAAIQGGPASRVRPNHPVQTDIVRETAAAEKSVATK